MCKETQARNMKTFLYLIILLALKDVCYGQQKFSIKGNAIDYECSIHLSYQDTQLVSNTHDGHFLFQGDIPHPIHARLEIKRGEGLQPYAREIILDEGSMDLEVDTGTMTINEHISFPALNVRVLQGGEETELLLHFETDAMLKGIILPEDEQEKFITDTIIQFFKDHPDHIAPLISLTKGHFHTRLRGDTLQQLYDLLDERFINTLYALRMKRQIDKLASTSTGNTVSDFEQMDIRSGKSIAISSLRGKYVLIEFWASWCVPCREENPRLKELYQKFKDSGFEILAVSLDVNPASWLQAIEKDGLPWLHVSDFRGWDNEVSRQFGVDEVPDNILIDPKGKIIGRHLSIDLLDEALSEFMYIESPQP